MSSSATPSRSSGPLATASPRTSSGSRFLRWSGRSRCAAIRCRVAPAEGRRVSRPETHPLRFAPHRRLAHELVGLASEFRPHLAVADAHPVATRPAQRSAEGQGDAALAEIERARLGQIDDQVVAIEECEQPAVRSASRATRSSSSHVPHTRRAGAAADATLRIMPLAPPRK